MFCSTDMVSIGQNGRFVSLGNKAHVLMEKTYPGLYVINCCVKCAKDLDFSSQPLLDAIHQNVLESKELALRATGVSEETIKSQRSLWDIDKPKSGWFAVETDIKNRQKLVERYKKYAEAQSRERK